MQRWVRLPQGGFLDATRIIYISKVESFARLDDEGHNIGVDYAVSIGISLARDEHLMVTGNKEEIGTLVRQILGQAAG
ncbi:MAG: hypothetical protein AB7E72_02015 [Lysobacterales bacterium]